METCLGPCGNPEARLIEMTGRFTYATNQNLLFEILKPLKAMVRVGSCSWGSLGYREEGGYVGGELVVNVGALVSMGPGI